MQGGGLAPVPRPDFPRVPPLLYSSPPCHLSLFLSTLRAAAKIILADDLFSTIAHAVKLGRAVYDNLRKVLLFQLPTNFAQGLSIVVAIIIGVPAPLEAIQVLTVNMVTGVSLGIVLTLEPPEPGIMSRPPRSPSQPLLDGGVAWRSFYVAVIIIVAILGLMQWELATGSDLLMARGATFSFLILVQCLYAVSCRFVTDSAFTPRIFFGNGALYVACVGCMAVCCFFVYVPGVNGVWAMTGIGGPQWGRVILLSLGIFLFVEGEKLVVPRFVTPVIGPPLAAALRALTRAARAACAGPRCALFCPTAAAAQTGLPTPRAASIKRVAAPAAAAAADAAADAGAAAEASRLAHSLPRPHRHVPPPTLDADSPAVATARSLRRSPRAPSDDAKLYALGSFSAPSSRNILRDAAAAAATPPPAAAAAAAAAPALSATAPPITVVPVVPE
jgi:hypothetical protein